MTYDPLHDKTNKMSGLPNKDSNDDSYEMYWVW